MSVPGKGWGPELTSPADLQPRASGGHVRLVMWAGAVDSLGLSFGWTAFNLITVYRHGLAAAAVLNAAMFVGVVLSAPATGWLTPRLDGRHVLQITALVEGSLRIGTFLLLINGAPIALVAVLVAVTNVAAWTGYAGMRAEISAGTGGVTAMTRYSAVVVGTESLGTLAAALLPITVHGQLSGGLTTFVMLLYALALVPTYCVARRSVVRRRTGTDDLAAAARRGPLILGAGIMMLCSGPTLLFVALAAKEHGRVSVAGAAIAFALGSLVASPVERAVGRMRLKACIEWPAWGIGMLCGWALAPWSVAGLLFAQFLSGVFLTGFQGVMDYWVAGESTDGESTVGLAQGSAARAAGSAVAVRVVPVFGTATAMTQLAVVGSLFSMLAAVLLFGVQAGSHRHHKTAGSQVKPATTRVSA